MSYTKIRYTVIIGIDIHGKFFIMKELTSQILERRQVFLLNPPSDIIQPLDEFLIDADLQDIDDDYSKYKDIKEQPLERGERYICYMDWIHSSSFNGDTTEYDSDYEFNNFTKLLTN